MEPVFRNGNLVIVQPGAAVRKGDRVGVRIHAHEAMAKVLGRRTEQAVELVSLNSGYPVRTPPAADIHWMARIVRASMSAWAAILASVRRSVLRSSRYPQRTTPSDQTVNKSLRCGRPFISQRLTD